MPKPKGATTFRLSLVAKDLLARLAGREGIAKTAILELAIRRLADEKLPGWDKTTSRPRKDAAS